MTAVLFQRVGHVALITLNRPDAKNTMNAEVFIGLLDAWKTVREDASIRVAVLTAAGTEDFCCGGDLGSVIPIWTGAREPQSEAEHRIRDEKDIVARVMLKSEPIYKPIISAINGRALGGGFEILLATDIRIAAENAVFGLPEPRSGIVPGAGTMVRLARQIPYAHAMRLLLATEFISAKEALSFGLVSEVVVADRLAARAMELAEKIATYAPLALEANKRTALETHTLSWDEAFKFEGREARRIMQTEDAREGPKAFFEKRRPNFRGL